MVDRSLLVHRSRRLGSSSVLLQHFIQPAQSRQNQPRSECRAAVPARRSLCPHRALLARSRSGASAVWLGRTGVRAECAVRAERDSQGGEGVCWVVCRRTTLARGRTTTRLSPAHALAGSLRRRVLQNEATHAGTRSSGTPAGWGVPLHPAHSPRRRTTSLRCSRAMKTADDRMELFSIMLAPVKTSEAPAAVGDSPVVLERLRVPHSRATPASGLARSSRLDSVSLRRPSVPTDRN